MKRIKIIICSIIFLTIIGIMSSSTAMMHYQTVGTPRGLVTETTLNVRKRPGTSFGIITTVNKNEYIRIFAKIGDWYVIQTDSDYLGAVSSKYVKLIYPNNSSNNQNTYGSGSSNAITSQLTTDEQEVFDMSLIHIS